jgi:hypothetical protein
MAGFPPDFPPHVSVHGHDFTVNHALNCARGGLPSHHRHNELRDLTASLLSEVCRDVVTEPELQPLTGEQFNYRSTITTDEARLDIRSQGFWNSSQTKDYYDVKVFNPFADSYRNRPPQQVYSQMEQLKRRAYEERVREVEHGTHSLNILYHRWNGPNCHRILSTFSFSFIFQME